MFIPHLQYDEVGGRRVQLLLPQTLLEQLHRLTGRGEQVRPQRHLRLPRAAHHRVQVDGKLADELNHARQQRVRDRLLGGGLLLHHLAAGRRIKNTTTWRPDGELKHKHLATGRQIKNTTWRPDGELKTQKCPSAPMAADQRVGELASNSTK